MRDLEKALTKLYTYIPQAEKVNKEISLVNIGWHIEHALLVIIKIGESVIKSDPNNYRWTFNLARIIIFSSNRFPRGKGRAPEIVKPKQIEKTDFDTLFLETRKAIDVLKKSVPNQYFVHPIFGTLNKKNTFIMLEIHTKHHIYIIEDILRKLK